ncbi:phosphotransferase [Paenibacillus sp. JCM 10914]|uniref:phosphotransferase enzyme family protein n=1 Tax=Paenibacillus sp. JCM 10914 TaxID=1236974 RepID=UPI0003CC87E5|nr:aminoglycoside phosphotransferase family protein [Paenibacillus sp. JCM 10914]GAE07409.1 homoserine kinase [Paenibacillus sp. JCM 10914]
MRTEQLTDIAARYGIPEPTVTFIRHNENRTYRAEGSDGQTYLLRIHQPVEDGMAGLQHTYEGLLGELVMLEELSKWDDLPSQRPLRNEAGDLITLIEIDGRTQNCSVITWLDGRDMTKDDVKDPVIAHKVGHDLARLHTFFRQHRQQGLEYRPSQGIDYNEHMVQVIRSGHDRGLFTSGDVATVARTVDFIIKQLKERGTSEWGLIHGDVNLGNTIISPAGEICFIDYGFYGPGYYLSDIAMGAMMVPSDNRERFLQGYYGQNRGYDEDINILEGFMLLSIIGYYVFMMENEAIHDWMRERMPRLCENYCIPYLKGARIFDQI